ncbi:MAG: 3-oxoacyl-ACP synthase III family protein [Syntrophales bacterium]
MAGTLILSTGSYLPEKVITNENLTQFSEEAKNMIGEKTGVYSRRNAAEDECTSDLAAKAGVRCIEKARFPLEEIEGIIVSTSSPDRIQPATAARVQYLMGARRAFAFDINSVCSGGTFGISLADSLIKSGKYKTILLIAAELYSRILNKNDFSTYPFFGDGAGAVLFRADNNVSRGVLHSCLMTDGSGNDIICVPGGGTMLPFEKMVSSKTAFFRMKGEKVFAFSVDKGPEIIRRVAAEAGISLHQVKCFVCHQANVNIIRRIAGIIGIPMENFFINLHRYGNTASASVLIALDEAISEGVVSEGDLVMTVSFGGGLSWGANLLKL